LISSVELPVPPVTGFTLSVQVIPDGQVVLRFTFSVMPASGIIIIAVLPDLPREIERLAGFALIE